MPRPSDLYASLGVAGYHSPTTSWVPEILPEIYVFPPEEDEEDVYCAFRAGQFSPFEPFFAPDNDAYGQRDPNTPTLTDYNALNHALYYIQQGTVQNPYMPVDPGSGAAMEFDCHQPIMSPFDPQQIFVEPSSRRSSFRDGRPSLHELHAVQTSHGPWAGCNARKRMSKFSKARAMMFQALNGSRSQRIGVDGRVVAGDTAVSQDSRRTRTQSASAVERRLSRPQYKADPRPSEAIGNVEAQSVLPIKDLKNSRRKSIRQLFALSRSQSHSESSLPTVPSDPRATALLRLEGKAELPKASEAAPGISAPRPRLLSRKSVSSLFARSVITDTPAHQIPSSLPPPSAPISGPQVQSPCENTQRKKSLSKRLSSLSLRRRSRSPAPPDIPLPLPAFPVPAGNAAEAASSADTCESPASPTETVSNPRSSESRGATETPPTTDDGHNSQAFAIQHSECHE